MKAEDVKVSGVAGCRLKMILKKCWCLSGLKVH